MSRNGAHRAAMTPKGRMLAAYRGLLPDAVPVAPEFWYYIPARLLGLDMVTLEREAPHWQALQTTFAHYATEGWGVVGAHVPCPDVTHREKWTDLGGGRFDSRVTTSTPFGTLNRTQRYDRLEPSWAIERAIKDFHQDWPAYEACSLGLVEEADFSGVNTALEAVGQDYLLEVAVAGPFFDYIATGREGGLEQGVYDLAEHPALFEALHERYIDYARRLTRAVFANTPAEAVFIGCCWSCLSLISPGIWRRWDLPVIRAVVEEAHAAGGLVHLHLHGRCLDIVSDVAEVGVDCVCPFERPPGGDIADMAQLRTLLRDRVTVNGNIHTVETLIRGGPDDVRREVEEILTQWGPDRRRLIVGTGDQVGWETPDENIAAMVEAVRK